MEKTKNKNKKDENKAVEGEKKEPEHIALANAARELREVLKKLKEDGSSMEAESDSGSGDDLVVEPVRVHACEHMGMRKRLRSARSCSESAESALSDEEAPARKVGATRKGRVRPAAKTDQVGLAKAKADLMAVQRKELQPRHDDSITTLVKAAETKSVEGSASSSARSISGDREEIVPADVWLQIDSATKIVDFVAKRSGNLKGNFVKALNTAVELIQSGSNAFLMLKTTDQSAKLEAYVSRLKTEKDRLQADNAQLQAEQKKMREEMGALKAEVVRLGRQGQPAPEVALSKESELARLLRQEMASISARFDALEGRILRPSLAGDRKAAEKTPAASYAAKAGTSCASAPSQVPKQTAPPKKAPPKSAPDKAATTAKAASTETAPVPAPAPAPSAQATQPGTSKAATQAAKGKTVTPRSQPDKTGKGKGKGKGKKADANPVTASAQDQSADDPDQGEWQTVTKKKKAAKKTKKSPKKKKAPRLQVPRSAAVVIALQPGAEKKGVTYASVLLEAKSHINLADIGITSLRFKRAITGARILEVPGEETGEKADSLASKLRECLNGEDVKISRPTKTAELRLSGLDDTVTKEEIASVAARVGGCTADDIKVGEIRVGPSGLGSAWLRCPIVAAKAIAGAGRLLVGWVSAGVTLLEPRPLQCYRCLYGGHVKHTCSSEEDRSDLCYRCSQKGHISGQCTNKLHCALCAAADKPAAHRIGAKSCVAHKKGKKGKQQTTQSVVIQAMDVAEPVSAPSS